MHYARAATSHAGIHDQIDFDCQLGTYTVILMGVHARTGSPMFATSEAHRLSWKLWI